MEFVWKKNVGFKFKIEPRLLLGLVALTGAMSGLSYAPTLVVLLRAALDV